jgi:hypothetical protein
MNDSFNKVLIGGSGLGSSAVVQEVVIPSVPEITEGVGILTQIVILIATLVGLFRKKKSSNNSNSQNNG